MITNTLSMMVVTTAAFVIIRDALLIRRCNQSVLAELENFFGEEVRVTISQQDTIDMCTMIGILSRHPSASRIIITDARRSVTIPISQLRRVEAGGKAVVDNTTKANPAARRRSLIAVLIVLMVLMPMFLLTISSEDLPGALLKMSIVGALAAWGLASRSGKMT